MNNWAEFETKREESGSGWVTRTLITTLGMLVGLTLFSSPTNAQLPPNAERIDPAYVNDPLGLISYSEYTRAYSISSIRPDLIEVYICNTPSGTWGPDQNRLVNQLREASSYFRWLSGGLYDPKFIMGGTVDSAEEKDCFSQAHRRSKSRSNSKVTGAIVMTDTDSVTTPRGEGGIWGWAQPGLLCGGDDCYYSKTGRVTQINSNVAPSGRGNRSTNTLVHEMGHLLSFPHSFSGDTIVDGRLSEYDNKMDIMSGGKGTIRFGTLAINRYAAGWIPDEQVKVYPVSGDNSHSGALYDLMPLGQPGWQMLVLPVQPGKFYALGARVKSGDDNDIPSEGVEVYLIDQPCDRCSGLWRRTKPVVAAGSSVGQHGHVYDAGKVIVLDDTRGIRVRVLKRTADGSGYTVWVGPGPLEGYFFDDEGSTHEMSINWLATEEITQGCDKNNQYRFCPKDKVTRAQMAVFLARFLDLTVTADDKASASGFNDVIPGAWYVGHLNALGRIASGYDDGTFRPSQPITRGEMAVMLNRALKLDANGNRDTAFTDVLEGTELATASANLYAAEITQGSTRCHNSGGSEPLFCPDDSLTRGQMAAFLYRSRDFRGSSDAAERRPDGREIRISWGTDASGRTGCPQGKVCLNYNYEFGEGFGPPPYTLECWFEGERERRWPPPGEGPRLWFGEPEEGCWVSGSSRTVSYVVVDGVKSNELPWLQSADVRAVRISVGEPSTRCPRNVDCWGLHRDYHYELTGFGPGPYTLECWARTSGGKWYRADKFPWRGDPTKGCFSWGESGRQTVYVVVDGVKSNELPWSDGPDDREVRIEWGADLSSDPDPAIREGCNDFDFCRAFNYELIGFGPGPHTYECWVNNQPWKSYPVRGREGCRARGNHLIEVYIVVDGVKSNELDWSRSDDEETQSDGREVRIEWGADLSSDFESDIRDGCSGFVFCRAFNYELIGFGPGPHTYECLINNRPWPPYPVRGREGCRARGNKLIVAHVVVDGVKSNPLRWTRPG